MWILADLTHVPSCEDLTLYFLSSLISFKVPIDKVRLKFGGNNGSIQRALEAEGVMRTGQKILIRSGVVVCPGSPRPVSLACSSGLADRGQ